MRKNNVYCHKLATLRLTKELKVFFAFAKSLPTSGTLPEKKEDTRKYTIEDFNTSTRPEPAHYRTFFQ